jgi:hypothetical protein
MSEEFIGWDYPGEFLKQFPQNHTGAVGHIFCARAREGHDTVAELLAAVSDWAEERLANPYPGDTEDSVRVARRLSAAVTTDECARFARFIIWRESLSYGERERLKAAARAVKGSDYMRQAMAGKPPTEKQLALLKRKGCTTIPRTRLEASEMIDTLLNGRVA